MASLRTRVLASVLVLSAAGLVALAAVTYAEQRSFLQGRIDNEIRGAAPALSFALDNAGFRPGGEGQPPAERSGPADGRGFPRRPGGGGPNLNLPPGTMASEETRRARCSGTC